MENKAISTAQWLTLSCVFILCYWPSYFIPSVEPFLMQKVYFVVMYGYFVAVILATRTRLFVPASAYIFVIPLVVMLIVFPFNIPKFSGFHFSVLIKPVLLFSYVVAFTSLLVRHFGLADAKRIKSALGYVFALQILIITLQIILGDNPILKVISYKEVDQGFGMRAPGTFDWVYMTCYFLSFYIGLYTIEYFLGQHKKRAFAYILLALFAILMSQSKTGYLATFLVAFYFAFLSLILNLRIANKIIFGLLFVISLCVGLLIYLGINLDYVTRFVEFIQEGRLDGSTSTRKVQTIVAINEGLNNWYQGSPLALKGKIIENSYLDYLFRYGILGLFGFLLMVLSLFAYSLRTCINARRLQLAQRLSFEYFQLATACHIGFVAAVLYCFTGTPIDAYRAAVWSSFMLSLTTFISYQNKKAFSEEKSTEALSNL